MTLGVPPSPPFIQVIALHPNQPQDPDSHPSCRSSRILLRSSIIAAKGKKANLGSASPTTGMGRDWKGYCSRSREREEAEDEASLHGRAWDKSWVGHKVALAMSKSSAFQLMQI